MRGTRARSGRRGRRAAPARPQRRACRAKLVCTRGHPRCPWDNKSRSPPAIVVGFRSDCSTPEAATAMPWPLCCGRGTAAWISRTTWSSSPATASSLCSSGRRRPHPNRSSHSQRLRKPRKHLLSRRFSGTRWSEVRSGALSFAEWEHAWNTGMRPCRKRLFIAMARNASSPIEHFGLPSNPP